MDERVLPTGQGLSEVAETTVEREGERAERPLESRTPRSKEIIREVSWEGGV